MAIIRFDPMGFPRFANRFPAFWEDEDMDMAMSQGMEVYETDEEVVVKAPVPGIPSEEVNVTFEDGVLRISAHHEETDEEKKKKKVVHRQQRLASYEYTTTLPRAVDGNGITAEVHDGVIVVKAPIAQEAKPKKITVKAKGK